VSLLIINSPYPRPSKFFGQPTSVLYAASLLVPWYERRFSESPHFINFNSWSFDLYLNQGHSFLQRFVRKVKPHIIAISTTSAAWSQARSIAEIAKSEGVAFVILGGPHEDDISPKTVEVDPNVDISISGDGETPFYRLVRIILENRIDSLPELEKYRAEWTHSNQAFGRFAVQLRGCKPDYVVSREKGRCLDELPSIPRHLMAEREKYHYPIFQWKDGTVKRCVQVMTQRGCIAKCEFCSESQRLDTRSAANVIVELMQIKQQGYEAIFFDDSTFTNLSQPRRKFLESVCLALKDLNLEWGCQTRVDSIDLDIAHAMKDAGCTYVYFGIETAEPDLLRRLGKKYSIATMDHALSVCKTVGLRVGASLILGTPDDNQRSLESIASAQKTFNYIRHYVDHGPIVLVSINFYGYYPGTLATQKLEKFNKLSPEVWETDQGRDKFPFSLLEEFPARMPDGLLELGPELLMLADESLGDVLIGRDRFTRNATIPKNVCSNDLKLAGEL
jgi:anaerobic magnesium-protoporphyrin IX monomethyl ester cyclase